MKTITIDDLKNMGVDTMSVKDNSVRGFCTKYTSDVKIGDQVIIDNCFVKVV